MANYCYDCYYFWLCLTGLVFQIHCRFGQDLRGFLQTKCHSGHSASTLRAVKQCQNKVFMVDERMIYFVLLYLYKILLSYKMMYMKAFLKIISNIILSLCDWLMI